MNNRQNVAKAKAIEHKNKVRPYQRGCITGKSPYGICSSCGDEGVECCASCHKDCNVRCGWIDKEEKNVPTVGTIDVPPDPDPEHYELSDVEEMLKENRKDLEDYQKYFCPDKMIRKKRILVDALEFYMEILHSLRRSQRVRE